MPRIAPVATDAVSPTARPQLEGVQKSLGFVPNLFQTLAPFAVRALGLPAAVPDPVPGQPGAA